LELELDELATLRHGDAFLGGKGGGTLDTEEVEPLSAIFTVSGDGDEVLGIMSLGQLQGRRPLNS